MITQIEDQKQKTVARAPVDVYEENDGFVILADMPGVDEKNMEISLEDDTLTITGGTAAQEPAGLDLLYREFEAVDFKRSFTIASDVDRERITATIRNGVLRLTLPKAKSVRRKIEVTS